MWTVERPTMTLKQLQVVFITRSIALTVATPPFPEVPPVNHD